MDFKIRNVLNRDFLVDFQTLWSLWLCHFEHFSSRLFASLKVSGRYCLKLSRVKAQFAFYISCAGVFSKNVIFFHFVNSLGTEEKESSLHLILNSTFWNFFFYLNRECVCYVMPTAAIILNRRKFPLLGKDREELSCWGYLHDAVVKALLHSLTRSS